MRYLVRAIINVEADDEQHAERVARAATAEMNTDGVWVTVDGNGAPVPARVGMTTYTVDCTPADGKRRPLRVRGASEEQALMGAYDYLARQWDGKGDVHEDTLTPIVDGGPALQVGS